MTRSQINGEFVNKLNISLFYETLAKVLGEQMDAEIEIVQVRKKTPRELSEMPDRMFIPAIAAIEGKSAIT